MALTEFLNNFSDFGPRLRQAAARAVQSLRDSSGLTILPQTTALFARSLHRYQVMADKSWSPTDCASFLIMEDERLTAALTHDHHFVQAGFRTLLH
jgi:predicted nucleic acid-binding protein